MRAAARVRRLARLRARGYASYQEYLRSEHWAEVKRRFRSQNGSTCFACGATPVEIHHRSYTRIGCEQMRDLVALCRACHEEARRLHQEHFGSVTLWRAAHVVRNQRRRQQRRDAAKTRASSGGR